MIFDYKVFKNKEISIGKIEADNKEIAIKNLKEQGLEPIKVEESITDSNKTTFTKCFKNDELYILFKELSLLLDSGLNIEKAIDILSEQFTKNKYIALNKISIGLRKGLNLSDAMEKTHAFPIFVTSLVYVGENTSSLRDVFSNLAVFYKKNNEIKSKIINALAYPIILLITTILVVNFLVSNVIPGFQEIFENSGTQLPLITSIIVNISRFLKEYNLFILIILFCFFAILLYINKKNPKITHNLWIKNKFYMLVKCLYFSFNMNILLTSGLTIDRSLMIIYQTENNIILKEKYIWIIENLKKGNSLWDSFKEINIFPKILVSLIKVGEESSNLQNSFKISSEFYSERLNIMSKKFLNILGPILIIILSFIIGVIVLAIALPIFDMVNQF